MPILWCSPVFSGSGRVAEYSPGPSTLVSLQSSALLPSLGVIQEPPAFQLLEATRPIRIAQAAQIPDDRSAHAPGELGAGLKLGNWGRA